MNYLPIENYGIIGNLETIALVSDTGSIDFMCFPEFDSASVFTKLLDDKKGGFFRINPAEHHKGIKYKQMYLPDTNILLTRFLGRDSVGEVIDFMPVGEKKLIRHVSTIRGELLFRACCSPEFNYARSKVLVKKIPGGVEFTSDGKEHLILRLLSDQTIHINESRASLEFSLKGGTSANFILYQPEEKEEKITNINEFISKALIKEIHYWRDWLSNCKYKGRWRETVYRSALVLKLLTSKKHGSMVAAPTFSLPERIGGKRNWDYRYTWIRDSSFSMYSLLMLGYTKEASDFINWVETKCMDISHAGQLRIMYKIDGNKHIDEEILTNLEGYKTSPPVRIGNEAFQQFQLDIYGELLNCVYLFDNFAHPISYNFWVSLSKQIDWLCDNWQRKDQSIWEIRAGEQEFLFSRMMCWVAFDRAIKLATNRSFPFNKRWEHERDVIFNDIYNNFWNEETQSFVQYKGGKAVDASTLMMPIIELISPRDPRWLSTLARIEKEIVRDSLVYRYSQESAAPDGMKGGEGTFSMCTFWYVECLTMAGELQKARFIFEKMMGYANHVGLFSEQLGMQGQHLGNFPQAFSHLGLINAAYKLNKFLRDEKNKDKSNTEKQKSFLL